MTQSKTVEGSDASAPEVAAIVLAAGASTRMGRPKALIEWRGRSFVAHAIERARSGGCGPIVVVTGAADLPDAALAGAVRCHNAAWERGPLSSLQRGLRELRELGAGSMPVLVLTVDRPHIRPATIDALMAARRLAPERIWQPEHDGTRGHPLLYPGYFAPAILALPDDGSNSPRDLLRLPEVAVLRTSVPVDDPAVLENLDTPQDLSRLPD